MSVVLPYESLYSKLTPEENAIALKKAEEIIKKAQLRSIGIDVSSTIEKQHVDDNSDTR